MPISSSSRSELTHDLFDYFPDGDIPEHIGSEIPRLWSKPLRPLNPETSLGFEVIDFSERVLKIRLMPWQKWLLVHALELNPDGTYRFRKLVILVGRQNGKTTLIAVLSLWWLYVDSLRHADRISPRDFLILGTAQDLDTAEEAWQRARVFCDPDPENEAGIPALQKRALKPVLTNGKTSLRLRSGQAYRVKAANRKGGRGKSAARVLMDELREQQNFDAWSSVTKTMNAKFNSQLWAISNAGDAKSVVLAHVRTLALHSVNRWDEYVSQGLQDAEEWANEHDVKLGLFEWSAPEGCDLDDPAAIAQANPSLGYLIEWATVMSDLRTDPEFVFRTEVLCQWVTAAIFTYIDPATWASLEDHSSAPATDSPLVMSVHTSANRERSYICIAGQRADGLAHVEVVARRPGMLWVPKLAEQIAEEHGITEVVVQAKGTPASELIEALGDVGLDVVLVAGSDLGSSTGKFRDRVNDGTLRHLGQPVLQVAVSGGITKRLGDQQFWDLQGSPVDIGGLIGVTYALYGLVRRREPVAVSAYVAMGEEETDDSTEWWR